MLKDIDYAFRTLRQSPGFALTAIVSIALAVGANSSIYSFANRLLLRPLPVPNPSQVFTLRSVPLSVNSLVLRGYRSFARLQAPWCRWFSRRGAATISMRSWQPILVFAEITSSP